jgi:hypothetical protein
LIVLLGCLIWSSTAYAGEKKVDQSRLPVTEAMVNQKLIFIGNLITRSKTFENIEARGDEDIFKEIANVKALYKKSELSVQQGDYEIGNNLLNEIVRIITSITRKESRVTNDQTKLLRYYNERKATIDALMNTFDEITKNEKVSHKSLEPRRRMIDDLLNLAKSNITNGEVSGAIVNIDKAYEVAIQITIEVRDGITLIRELKFETAKDEYLYEIDRNESHYFLLDITVREKKPSAKMLLAIQKLRDESDGLRADADKEAKSENYESAIDILNKSTKNLIRAIRMGGNFIPG